MRAFLTLVEDDLNLVNLFRGQAKNQRFDLEFDDYSIKIPFDSTNAEYVGRGITAQIKLATLTVCLYGPTTYQSKWVIWELNKTLEMGKPIMGVCLYNDGRVKYYPGPAERLAKAIVGHSANRRDDGEARYTTAKEMNR